MNWLHFLLWLAGIYSLYYLTVFLIDTANSRASPTVKGHSNELTFSEDVQPMALVHEPARDAVKVPAKVKAEPEVISSGGVILRDLFTLARQESIIYTRTVSY
jgi:hypothetical protein